MKDYARLSSVQILHGIAREIQQKTIQETRVQWIERVLSSIAIALNSDHAALLVMRLEPVRTLIGRFWPKSENMQVRDEIRALRSQGVLAKAWLSSEVHWFRDQSQHISLIQSIRFNGQVMGIFYAKLSRSTALDNEETQAVNLVLSHLAALLEIGSLKDQISRQKDDMEAAVELRAREVELFADVDALTGLLNRRKFLYLVDQVVAKAGRTHWVVVCSLTDYERVNRSFGPRCGDDLLCEISNRIKKFVHRCIPPIIAARLDNKSFAFQITGASWNHTAVEAWVQQLSQLIAAPLTLVSNELLVSCRIGIALQTANTLNANQLITNAELAADFSRIDVSRAFWFFDEIKIARSFTRELLLESQLHQALHSGALELSFQPKVSLCDGGLTGAEALLRWNHNEYGRISPKEFINIAERSSLIGDVGIWTFRQVCRQMNAWQKRGMAPIAIAVNLSAKQLQYDNLVADIESALQEFQIEPNLLQLELTETSFIHDVSVAIDQFHKLNELGLSIAIDDFGVGYNSLKLLKELPISSVKIDKCFIQDLGIKGRDKDDSVIVRAVIDMCHNMGKSVIAEGVETKKQIEILKGLHCDQIQGFYLSEPLSADEFMAYTQSWGPWQL